jgi:murein DD-endopeptidase MepM/ murein hydrolase activator NlpD
VVYFAKPTQSFGYYRGNPIFQNEGSGQGVDMAGSNVFAAGSGTGTAGDNTTWTPTILYLLVLIVVEMFVFAFIARRI